MTFTLSNLKSVSFLNIPTKDTDVALQSIMDGILDQVLNFMENSDITVDTINQFPDVCRALLKQCAFEWKRRDSLGLASVSFPDGSINRYDIDEFLPETEKIFDRWRVLAL